MAMEISCAEMGEVLHRGRLYDRYSEKRETKLREEWFLRMEQKEAEMRALWVRFDRVRAPSFHQEISRLSDAQSDTHTRQKIMTKSNQGEKKNKTTALRNSSLKKSALDSHRSTFSMPLTTKENRAPTSNDRLNLSSSMSSTGSLSRSRTITITGEEKKSKPVQSHHRRNTLAGPAEFKGLELDKNFYPDSSNRRKSHISKSFLKKGSGIGPGSGAAIAKQRSSIDSEQRDTDYSFISGNWSSSQESLNEFLVPSSTCLTCSGSESADHCSSKEDREAIDVVRERKKWGIPEKALVFSGESQKDGTRGLKKLLLNIVGIREDKN
ncbi:hypothetical protein FCM35_KLT04532 [Carex littledalei]|uniref:Uncharacterized protein n=1 Tax=Carex littledalei TaxID=544730 RepID=A0A833R8I1_9POAL|nr:hypothetical protein FCM35_KLT04532 [Carex littledalei]